MEKPDRRRRYRYACCLACEVEWMIDGAPVRCPTCGEPVQNGSLDEAWRRVYARNGL